MTEVRHGAAPMAPRHEQQTVERYFRAFSSLPWSELPPWPPDVFCLCNLLLDRTESYRFVVAPPHGRSWPPTASWFHDVAAAASRWAYGEVARCPPRIGLPGAERKGSVQPPLGDWCTSRGRLAKSGAVPHRAASVNKGINESSRWCHAHYRTPPMPSWG